MVIRASGDVLLVERFAGVHRSADGGATFGAAELAPRLDCMRERAADVDDADDSCTCAIDAPAPDAGELVSPPPPESCCGAPGLVALLFLPRRRRGMVRG